MNKILLALQFWEKDKAQAMELARLIADLEPGKSEVADFLFVSRYDCSQDIPTIQHVARKFNVHHFVCKRRGTGWPCGCNELWLGTMEWVYRMKEARKIPPYKAVFTFEADGAPLQPGWIPHFSNSWDSAMDFTKGRLSAMGHITQPGVIPEGHMNGNAIFTCEIGAMRKICRQVDGTPASAGWDYVHAPFFKDLGWANFSSMLSLWNTPTIEPERIKELRRSGVVWLHGIKDFSLINSVRKEFIGG